MRPVLKGATTSTNDVFRSFSSVLRKFSAVCKKAALIDVKSVQNSFLLKGKKQNLPGFTPQGSARKGGKKKDDDFKIFKGQTIHPISKRPVSFRYLKLHHRKQFFYSVLAYKRARGLAPHRIRTTLELKLTHGLRSCNTHASTRAALPIVDFVFSKEQQNFIIILFASTIADS